MSKDLPSNPFTVFNLPLTLPVDQKKLTEAYFELQKELHPDRDPSPKTGLSSAQVNQLYQDLKKLSCGARHLLELQDVCLEVDQQDPALLMIIMEWEERLQECSKNEQDSLVATLEKKKEQLVSFFMDLYQENALSPGQKEDELKYCWQELRYYEQLLNRHRHHNAH